MTSLAVDIGAESGRVLAGSLVDGKLTLSEVARFPNTPINLDGTLRWDIESLIANVEKGIARFDGSVASVGVDTWGVDYVLLDPKGQLVEPPFHYRDQRTNGMMDRVDQQVPLVDIYRETGIQFLPFNTIFQLATTLPSTFEKAESFLTIPDYIHYRLSTEKRIACEYSNATTTQLLNAKTGDWSDEILGRLNIPRRIFPSILASGTKLGAVNGLDAELIVPACHDTGSAVVAIPSESANVAWISSGTWSILGVESPRPIVTDHSYRLNYTNEGGVFGTTRFCKNVMGLWILQECRRHWDDQESYADLVAQAEQAGPARAWIDPDDARFLPPGDMASRIQDFLSETDQAQPGSKGEIVRIVLESLALKYAVLVDQIEGLVGYNLEAIHIFGGGSQNALLNQMTANACQRPVVAGPVEATAIGNLLMQMITLGTIPNLPEGRRIVRQSFPCPRFDPADKTEWESKRENFQNILNR